MRGFPGGYPGEAMTVPSITLVEQDGNIGVLPPGQKILAIIGTSTTGTKNAPAAYASQAAVVAAFGQGPLVEAAAYHINTKRQPVLLVRSEQTTAGTMGTIDVTGVTGTATDTSVTGVPSDDMDLWCKVITGFTAGVTGGVIQLSYDGGRTYGPSQAQGTSLSIPFTDCGSAAFTLVTSKTLVAGDIIKTRTTAPKWNATDLTAAVAALGLSVQPWELCEIYGAMSASEFDTCVTAFSGLTSKSWIGHVAMPTSAQTEATYLSALVTSHGSKSTTQGVLCAGACKLVSAVSGRQYRRPIVIPVATLAASVDESVDLAQTTLDALPGVAIRDANGNPDEHDETANPGLDDARFCTLRTVDGKQGVFVNNPRLFSPAGSDFQFLQHRRVMNLAKTILSAYFIDRLSKGITVNSSTGFIDDAEADEIEKGADAVMRAGLLAKPKVSGGGVGGKRTRFVQVSRTDNLLSTSTMTVQASVIPLAYTKAINITLGFKNPALQVIKAT